MNQPLRIVLQTSGEQAARLGELQRLFAQACNVLTPLVQSQRCWNRVTLHHLAYHMLRERFPALGSQMACNAIYSVCRAARLVYQAPDSPFNVARMGARPLPLLRFSADSPVYFDRHTLSLRKGELSMYTLDGRMRFQLALAAADQARFRDQRVLEIVLVRRRDGAYELSFLFAPQQARTGAVTARPRQRPVPPAAAVPEYLQVEVA